MTEIVVATRSADKLAEIREAVGTIPGLRLIDLDEAGIAPDPAEDGIEIFETFEENALAKGRFFLAKAGRHVLADDSGLCVEALGGGPGVRSKRFAPSGNGGGLALDAANNAHLLALLHDVPEPRSAHYICVLALVSPSGEERTFEGRVDGEILREGRGSGGFGYDPLFFVPELDRTFAEVDRATKNRLSHRARAVGQAAPILRSLAAPS